MQSQTLPSAQPVDRPRPGARYGAWRRQSVQPTRHALDGTPLYPVAIRGTGLHSGWGPVCLERAPARYRVWRGRAYRRADLTVGELWRQTVDDARAHGLAYRTVAGDGWVAVYVVI